ncbi:FG-GAP-like repeat-containing protein, partial [Pseudomonadota bacterium]
MQSDLKSIEVLMMDRQFGLAQNKLKELVVQYPSQYQPRYLLAESHYRMAHLDIAKRMFAELVIDFPNKSLARPRKWSTQLAPNPQNKSIRRQIEEEIAALLESSEGGIEEIYAAYQGYSYLEDNQRRVQKLQELAPLVGNHALGANVAAYLLEEILGQRNKALRITLAQLYLNFFAKRPGLPIATAWLVATMSEQYADRQPFEQQISKLLVDFPDNRFLYQQIARNLVQRNHNLEQALDLLLDHEQKWQSEAKKNHLSEHQNHHGYDPFWHEYSQTLMLLGVVYLRLDQLDNAKARLNGIALEDPVYPKARHFLAVIEEQLGNVDGAIELYRAALVAGTAYQDTEPRLKLLLEQVSGQKQLPRQYFYPEASIRFADVTETAGLGNIKAHRVAWGDYDNDGLDDLAIDGARLYRNQGNGSFKNVNDSLNMSAYKGYTGGVWADVDNDGWLDLFLTHRHNNRLLRNLQGER